MPFNKTSYDTIAGSILPSHRLEAALKEALVSTGLPNQNFGISPVEGISLVFVAGLEAGESHVPAFVHPYLIENFKGKSYLIADVRAYKNHAAQFISAETFEASVKNKPEYMLTKNRAVLELKWVAGMQSALRSKFSFAGNVFAAWISQSVSKVYGLDFYDQRVIMAIAMYYYHTLFTDKAKLEEKALDIAVIHTIKATKLSEREIMDIFNAMPDVTGLDSLCVAIRDIVKNVRLADFNQTMLVTLVQNTWYGNNARDIIAVALEHPPTWIAVVFAALTEKTYKSCQLYRLIEAQARGGNVSEFKLNYMDEILSTTVVTESAENEIEFREF